MRKGGREGRREGGRERGEREGEREGRRVKQCISLLLLQLTTIERLKPRLQVMAFMGNLEDDLQLVSPVSGWVHSGRGLSMKLLLSLPANPSSYCGF